jgi:hypothetical protein
MSNPNTFQDVHRYDGKISHFISTRFDNDYKMKVFDKFLSSEEIKQQSHMIPAFKMITDNIGAQSIYDPTNKYYADDILIEILELLEKNKEIDAGFIIMLLFEQMNDMMNLGPCSAGKCHRLYQIYNAIKFTGTLIQFYPEFIGDTIELEYKILIL